MTQAIHHLYSFCANVLPQSRVMSSLLIDPICSLPILVNCSDCHHDDGEHGCFCRRTVSQGPTCFIAPRMLINLFLAQFRPDFVAFPRLWCGTASWALRFSRSTNHRTADYAHATCSPWDGSMMEYCVILLRRNNSPPQCTRLSLSFILPSSLSSSCWIGLNSLSKSLSPSSQYTQFRFPFRAQRSLTSQPIHEEWMCIVSAKRVTTCGCAQAPHSAIDRDVHTAMAQRLHRLTANINK